MSLLDLFKKKGSGDVAKDRLKLCSYLTGLIALLKLWK